MIIQPTPNLSASIPKAGEKKVLVSGMRTSPPAARAASRFQVVDAQGCAWLLVLDGEGWWTEGRYD